MEFKEFKWSLNVCKYPFRHCGNPYPSAKGIFNPSPWISAYKCGFSPGGWKKGANFPKSQLFWAFLSGGECWQGLSQIFWRRIYLNFLNYSVLPDDNLNFGIKTLEEIKLKKLKEKAKKQGGELISLISLLSYPLLFILAFNPDFPWIICKRRNFFCTLGSSCRDSLPWFLRGLLWPVACFPSPAWNSKGKSKGNC